MILDPNGVVHTRGLGTLVGADNGLYLNNVGGTPTVELGSTASGGANLLTDRFVTLNTKKLTFDGAGDFNIGSGSAVLNTKIDVGSGGTLTLKNLNNAADSTFITVDNNGVVHTRSLTAIVGADNGLSMKSDGTTVEMGGALIKNTSIGMATFALNYTGAGSFNIGDASGILNTKIDPGVGGTLTVNNLTGSTDTNMMIISPTGVVHTRSINSLVNADNGLTTTAGSDIVELGSTASGGANLLHNSFVSLNGKDLNFDGAGNFNIGAGGATTMDVKIDPGTAGTLTLNNLTTTTDTTILILDAQNHVHVRALNSLVTADNGLTTNASDIVELGSAATGGAPLLHNSFVSLNSGKTLNFESDGTINVGTGGNMNLAVNTGSTGNMSINGSTLDAGSNMNNFLWADTATGNVRRTKTSAIATNASPSYYITIDQNGVVTKSNPNTTIIRGQIAGTGTFQYTASNLGIKSGAAITLTVENHTGVLGAIVAQVTTVTPESGGGGNGSFSVESSENIQNGSFINYIVVNP
jgi:hypothetical protein